MEFLKSLFTENINFKLVSLFIAIILWVTILGRRDFVYSKNLNIEIKVADGLTVRKSSEQVRVRVEGTRNALKKFLEEERYGVLQLDLRMRDEGIYDIEITPDLIKAPLGVKTVNIRPAIIRAEIEKSSLNSKQEHK